MSNRVIKDGIWFSDKLARCTIIAQLHYPRLYLLIDDWGCFEIDIDVIKGKVYPKMKVNRSQIESFLNEYTTNGLLFIWQINNKIYGYFTGEEEGRLPPPSRRHKRHTFVPSKKELQDYLNKFSNLHDMPTKGFKVDSNKVQSGFPNLNPNLNPKPNLKNIHEQNELEELFEKWWKRYPRTEDKGKAKSLYLNLVENEGVEVQVLEDALTGYINVLNNNETPRQYIKHAKTFLYNGNKAKKIPSTWGQFVKFADPKYKAKPPL